VATEIVIEWPEGPKRYAMPESFTYREMGRIKTLTGIRAGEIEDALLAGDTDVIIAIAQIAAERANDTAPIEALENLEFGAIRVEVEADPTPAASEAAEDHASAPQTTPDPGGTQDS
jgi:hypothetical protein